MSRNHVLTFAITIFLTSCSTNPPDANRKAFDAWKAKDAKFFTTFLSDKFVGHGTTGRLNKAQAEKEFSGADCDIASYAISNERTTPLDTGIELITFDLDISGKCAGTQLPPKYRAATVLIREGSEWKWAYYTDTPIADPKTVTPVQIPPPTPTPLDPDTERLLTAEKAIWEAWKDGDRQRIESLITPEISFINIFGTFFPSRAEAVKDWTSHGCQVSSVGVTSPQLTRLSPKVAILTFTGSADGTCFGQKIGSIWGTSIYLNSGDQWKWTFGFNVPAH